MVLLRDNKLDAKQLVHVGDAIQADFLIPKRLGIRSVLIEKNIVRTKFIETKTSNLSLNILESFINNSVETNDPYEHFGYEVLGPILYSFTSWLRDQVKKDKIQKLVFFARDAKIIMKTYEKRFGKDVASCYLRISRKAALNAMLDDAKSLDDILVRYKVIRENTTTIRELLKILDLKTKIDVQFSGKVISELNQSERRELFQSISDDLNRNTNEQKSFLLRYLMQNKIEGKVGFVDVGWNGSTQYCLEKILNDSFMGYYYGVNKDKKYEIYEKTKRKGFLFGDQKYDKNQALIWMNSGIFELMFLAPEGTTESYADKNGVVRPILGECEYSKRNLVIVKKIQNGALEFVEDAMNSSIKEYLDAMTSEVGFDNFKNFSIYPKQEYIDLFKNLEFMNFESGKLLDNRSLRYYVSHPKKFYRNLMDNHCRIWFLKEVFKIDLPYFTILEIAYKKLKKIS